MQQLCELDHIEEGDARGFEITIASETVAVVCIRQGQKVFAYRNRCPHTGINLEWLPDQFLDDTRQYVVCSTHGAMFQVEDGHCVTGPCAGDSLDAVPVKIEKGVVLCDI